MKDKKNLSYNPYNWNNISGDKYWSIVDVLEDTELDDITKQATLVSIIEDCNLDTILTLPLAESREKISKLTFLNSFPYDDRMKYKHVSIGDTTYDVCPNVSQLTTGQYIDYQTFVKLPFREAYDKLISIFIIPSGCSYNEGYDIIEVQKDIREKMSWVEAQNLLGFILREYVTSYTHSLKSIRRSIKKEKDLMKKEVLQSKMRDLEIQMKVLVHSIGYASLKL